MYLQSARCCDNTHASMPEVQQCIERCSQPLQAAQNYMQSEMSDFMVRIQMANIYLNQFISLLKSAKLDTISASNSLDVTIDAENDFFFIAINDTTKHLLAEMAGTHAYFTFQQ